LASALPQSQFELPWQQQDSQVQLPASQVQSQFVQSHSTPQQHKEFEVEFELSALTALNATPATNNSTPANAAIFKRFIERSCKVFLKNKI
jgi:hypothetical protein